MGGLYKAVLVEFERNEYKEIARAMGESELPISGIKVSNILFTKGRNSDQGTDVLSIASYSHFIPGRYNADKYLLKNTRDMKQIGEEMWRPESGSDLEAAVNDIKHAVGSVGSQTLRVVVYDGNEGFYVMQTDGIFRKMKDRRDKTLGVKARRYLTASLVSLNRMYERKKKNKESPIEPVVSRDSVVVLSNNDGGDEAVLLTDRISGDGPDEDGIDVLDSGDYVEINDTPQEVAALIEPERPYELVVEDDDTSEPVLLDEPSEPTVDPSEEPSEDTPRYEKPDYKRQKPAPLSVGLPQMFTGEIPVRKKE